MPFHLRLRRALRQKTPSALGRGSAIPVARRGAHPPRARRALAQLFLRARSRPLALRSELLSLGRGTHERSHVRGTRPMAAAVFSVIVLISGNGCAPRSGGTTAPDRAEPDRSGAGASLPERALPPRAPPSGKSPATAQHGSAGQSTLSSNASTRGAPRADEPGTGHQPVGADDPDGLVGAPWSRTRRERAPSAASDSPRSSTRRRGRTVRS